MKRSEISWVLGSDDPKKLAEFYALAMDSEIQPGLSSKHWIVVHPNGIKIQIYSPSSKKITFPKGRNFAPCLYRKSLRNPVVTIQEWVSDLISIGASVSENIKKEPFGYEIWMMDPENNHFLLIVSD
tara:strand:+ start:361 stop:741 length:381 start_codon:yes stop_codon:yes gene_type:complete